MAKIEDSEFIEYKDPFLEWISKYNLPPSILITNGYEDTVFVCFQYCHLTVKLPLHSFLAMKYFHTIYTIFHSDSTPFRKSDNFRLINGYYILVVNPDLYENISIITIKRVMNVLLYNRIPDYIDKGEREQFYDFILILGGVNSHKILGSPKELTSLDN